MQDRSRWVGKCHLVLGNRVEIWDFVEIDYEFSHNEIWHRKWCFGNREGIMDSDKAVGEEGGGKNDFMMNRWAEMGSSTEVDSVIGSGGKDDELARIDWSGMK